MKKMLLLCPKFMGYEQILCDFLKKEYIINYVDTEEFFKPTREIYKKNNFFIRAFFKIIKPVRKIYIEKLMDKYNDRVYNLIKKENSYDLILVINGDGISNNIYKRLFNEYINSKIILYLWDDVNLLFKKDHIAFFEHISSYNIDDCKKYNFNYQPVFSKENYKNLKKIYDLAIVASATKERVRFAKKIYNKYSKKYNIYVYFYDKNNKYNFFSRKNPLSYDQYQDVLAQSKVIIDCTRGGQKGPTTRIFDSIITKTKVISTNKNLKKYPIYDSNIYIINKKCEIPHEFINDEYKDNNTYRKPITVEDWFGNINRSN